MTFSRRLFLQSAYGVALSYSALALNSRAGAYTANARLALISDPKGLLDLPQGFSYKVVSMAGEMMSDGFFRPGRPDGMACFPHADDPEKCILMRNHENWPDTATGGPFGEDDALASRLDAAQIYDRKADGRPYIGGVTTLVYDLKNQRLEKDFLSLAGTTGNCAGGATPWGSWLSCEEAAITQADGAQKPHGFVFEVPISATGPVDAAPLTAMGRFAHEAAAVDPDTDIVYMTEDAMTGLFYRFLPNERQNLAAGGRLQALVIKDNKSADTRNWPREGGSIGPDGIEIGREMEVEWVDLDDVEAPDGDLAARGFAAGAARFCRGEGMDYGRHPEADAGEIYFNCTNGGVSRTGQVWRYRPSENEGRRGEKKSPGMLTLIYESPNPDTLDLCDNLAFAPWGDIILCEDGSGDQFLRGLTPSGEIYDIARNAETQSAEFCGACFSPDGSVMFVNVQEPGYTFAIEGPWDTLRG